MEDFERDLHKLLIGQDSAIRQLARVYQAGLAGPGRPLANLLLLGPTGSGKTRLVEAAAEVLFGTSNAVLKIDCDEFQHSHEIAKLIGWPPGYLGHRETQPLITQHSLEQYHTEQVKLSLVLFDEIEKASDALWQLLLGILDKATLTLGDNQRVDLSRCVIFLTSNLGTVEMNKLMSGTLGFSKSGAQDEEALDEKIYRVASEAARRKFSPEFMNRIDKVIVLRSLKREHLEQILDIELGRVQQRIMSCGKGAKSFVFNCTAATRDFLLREGIDPKFGARHRREIIQSIQLYADLHRFIPALAAAAGARIAEISISNPPRAHGKSNYGISRAFRVFLDLLSTKFLLDYSTRPLHFLGFFALLLTGAGSLMGSVAVLKSLLFHQSLMLQNGALLFGAALFTLAGIQLLGLGLVSEILSRTYYESQKKPIYTTRQIQSHVSELTPAFAGRSFRPSPRTRRPSSRPSYVVDSQRLNNVTSLNGAA